MMRATSVVTTARWRSAVSALMAGCAATILLVGCADAEPKATPTTYSPVVVNATGAAQGPDVVPFGQARRTSDGMDVTVSEVRRADLSDDDVDHAPAYVEARISLANNGMIDLNAAVVRADGIQEGRALTSPTGADHGRNGAAYGVPSRRLHPGRQTAFRVVFAYDPAKPLTITIALGGSPFATYGGPVLGPAG